MRNRHGVLLLMIDLPMQTAAQRAVYRHFRTALKKAGFRPLQESVYVCLLRNISSTPGLLHWLDQISPKQGLVQVLPMSLQTFKAMKTLRGDSFDLTAFSDDFLLIRD